MIIEFFLLQTSKTAKFQRKEYARNSSERLRVLMRIM